MNKKELDEHRRRLIEILKEKEQENEKLQQRIDKAIEILHAMKHCELLLGGNKKVI